jgi:hypothetical protein
MQQGILLKLFNGQLESKAIQILNLKNEKRQFCNVGTNSFRKYLAGRICL